MQEAAAQAGCSDNFSCALTELLEVITGLQPRQLCYGDCVDKGKGGRYQEIKKTKELLRGNNVLDCLGSVCKCLIDTGLYYRTTSNHNS